jgi:hypothetical protein
MLKGFKQFLLRGNVVDLAVAVVLGAAFGAVVSALVKDLITPLIAAIFGKPKPAPPSTKVQPPPPEAAILGIPPLPPPPKIWAGGLELGLNGSAGNSDVLKIRIGFDVKRDTPTNLFTASGWYGMANQNGVLSENKAIFNARDELPFPNSPWGRSTKNRNRKPKATASL